VNGLWSVSQQFAVVSLQGAVFALFVVAVRRRNAAAAVNALGAFALAVLPVALPRAAFGPVLPAWLAAAGVLHSLGMLGRYESTWWWDHLTHTVSGALVAALLYAGALVAPPDVAGLDGPSAATVTVAFTVAVGVFWELVELVARDVGEWLGVEPVLVHYGWRDTAADLGFDVVGALLVIGADLRVFVPAVEQFPGVTAAALVGGGWVVVGGSALMALFVGLGASTRS
jgi:hypothetical protein